MNGTYVWSPRHTHTLAVTSSRSTLQLGTSTQHATFDKHRHDSSIRAQGRKQATVGSCRITANQEAMSANRGALLPVRRGPVEHHLAFNLIEKVQAYMHSLPWALEFHKDIYCMLSGALG